MQLLQGNSLDMPDFVPGKAQFFPDLIKGAIPSVIQPETQPQNHRLPRLQNGQKLLGLFA